MPHKRKRDRNTDQDLFELPPTIIATPLSTSKNSKSQQDTQKRDAKRKQSRNNDDDTPRAFARLMAWQQGMKPKSGLDDGAPKKKKKRKPDEGKPKESEQQPHNEQASAPDIPKIMPGERMNDYSARVDAALPLKGLVTKGKNLKLPGIKRQQTKTERKLQRMHKEWRETDARWKEKLREAKEEAEEEEDPHEDILNAVRSKKKRRKGAGSDDEDPWAVVAKARQEQQQPSTGLIGLHDVVKAPPELKAPKERFKVKNGARVDVADVPNTAGSLRRREELGQTRQNVVDGYRRIVKANKGRL